MLKFCEQNQWILWKFGQFCWFWVACQIQHKGDNSVLHAQNCSEFHHPTCSFMTTSHIYICLHYSHYYFTHYLSRKTYLTIYKMLVNYKQTCTLQLCIMLHLLFSAIKLSSSFIQLFSFTLQLVSIPLTGCCRRLRRWLQLGWCCFSLHKQQTKLISTMLSEFICIQSNKSLQILM